MTRGGTCIRPCRRTETRVDIIFVKLTMILVMISLLLIVWCIGGDDDV